MLNEDKHLISRLKQNDQKAFDEIFQIYYSRVYNLAFRFLHSREETEEIVQTVFITIWESRQKIDEEKSFTAYIYSIARHLTYNQLKKAVYKQRFIEYSLQGTEPVENVSEDTFYFKELQQLLEEAMAELPPRRREIFHLSRNKGLSYKEIATRLSVTESTVNTQISKAIEFLKEKLKDYR